VKKATVTANFLEASYGIEGYAVELSGVPMVVHRAVNFEGKRLSGWTVTERITGRAAGSGRTRAAAIERAASAVDAEGGPVATRAAVASFVAQRCLALLKAENEAAAKGLLADLGELLNSPVEAQGVGG
jgi:hypothetical protein